MRIVRRLCGEEGRIAANPGDGYDPGCRRPRRTRLILRRIFNFAGHPPSSYATMAQPSSAAKSNFAAEEKVVTS
jgi:hypothetical protein